MKRRPPPAKLSHRRCKLCNADISKKHPNARFCNQVHKDRYHNITNPRGFYAPGNNADEAYDYEGGGWDAHKDVY